MQSLVGELYKGAMTRPACTEEMWTTISSLIGRIFFEPAAGMCAYIQAQCIAFVKL